MFDGFWSGMIGGLFGPALVRWAGQYKYRLTFFTVTFGVYICMFILGSLEFGVRVAFEKMGSAIFTPAFLFVPSGIGLLAVFIVALYSATTPKESDKNSTRN